jgi:hypothetical protein
MENLAYWTAPAVNRLALNADESRRVRERPRCDGLQPFFGVQKFASYSVRKIASPSWLMIACPHPGNDIIVHPPSEDS